MDLEAFRGRRRPAEKDNQSADTVGDGNFEDLNEDEELSEDGAAADQSALGSDEEAIEGVQQSGGQIVSLADVDTYLDDIYAELTRELGCKEANNRTLRAAEEYNLDHEVVTGRKSSSTEHTYCTTPQLSASASEQREPTYSLSLDAMLQQWGE